MPTIRDEIQAIITRAVEGAVQDALRARDRNGAAQGRRGRKPGAVSKGRRRGRGGRRDSDQIAATVEKVLKFVKQHSGLTTEGITKEMGGDKAAIRDALARLRASKQVTTKGQKRAMTYSA